MKFLGRLQNKWGDFRMVELGDFENTSAAIAGSLVHHVATDGERLTGLFMQCWQPGDAVFPPPPAPYDVADVLTPIANELDPEAAPAPDADEPLADPPFVEPVA